MGRLVGIRTPRLFVGGDYASFMCVCFVYALRLTGVFGNDWNWSDRRLWTGCEFKKQQHTNIIKSVFRPQLAATPWNMFWVCDCGTNFRAHDRLLPALHHRFITTQ